MRGKRTARSSRTVEQTFAFLTGLTCSMNALMIRGVAVFNYIFVIWIAYKLIDDRLAHRPVHLFNKTRASFFVVAFAVSSLISIIMSIGQLPSPWVSAEVKALIKYLLVFPLIFCLYTTQEGIGLRDHFFDGLKLGAVIQMVWGLAQVALFSLFKFKLNTFVFGEVFSRLGCYGGTEYVWDSYVGSPIGLMLRMKGIGWETANLSLVLIIGYVLALRDGQKNLAMMFALSVAISTSRTGLLALAVVMVWQFFVWLQKEHKQLRDANAIEILVGIGIVLALVVVAGKGIATRANQLFNAVGNAFTVTNAEESNAIHIGYYTNLPELLRKSSPENIVFGYGYFSAGYPYSRLLDFSKTVAKRVDMVGWNPESDFVTLLVGNGVIGLCLYYVHCVVSFWKNRKNYMGGLIVAVIAAGIMYLTLRGTWSLLVVLFAGLEPESADEAAGISVDGGGCNANE